MYNTFPQSPRGIQPIKVKIIAAPYNNQGKKGERKKVKASVIFHSFHISDFYLYFSCQVWPSWANEGNLGICCSSQMNLFNCLLLEGCCFSTSCLKIPQKMVCWIRVQGRGPVSADFSFFFFFFAMRLGSLSWSGSTSPAKFLKTGSYLCLVQLRGSTLQPPTAVFSASLSWINQTVFFTFLRAGSRVALNNPDNRLFYHSCNYLKSKTADVRESLIIAKIKGVWFCCGGCLRSNTLRFNWKLLCGFNIYINILCIYISIEYISFISNWCKNKGKPAPSISLKVLNPLNFLAAHICRRRRIEMMFV